MVLLINARLSEDDKNFLIEDADNRMYYVFGLSDDQKLVNLVPFADDFMKWSSICHDCHLSASFMEYGKILCRRCRNYRRSVAEKVDADRAGRDNKRTRELDSDDKMLVKKALNLSIQSSDGSIATDNEVDK